MLNHMEPMQSEEKQASPDNLSGMDHFTYNTQPELFQTKTFEVAKVVRCEDKALCIEQNGQEFTAKLAYSCAIEPLASDKVLFYRTPDQIIYVIAILERTELKPALMKFPHGIQIEAPSLQQMTYDWKVESINTNILTENANIQSDQTQFFGKSIKLVSSTILTIAEMLTQKLKLYFRDTEKQDRVEAQELVRSAKREYQLTAGYGSISVKHHLTVDGEQVIFN